MTDINELKSFLNVNGIAFRENVLGSSLTTFRTGGDVRFVAEPETSEEALLVINYAAEKGLRYFIIGNGSNLLIPDEGLDILFIRLSGKLKEFEIKNNTVFCGAGASLAAAAKASVAEGLMGFEWASGIPGSVGGAIAMNASAYDGEIRQILKRITAVYQGRIVDLKVDPDLMAYRHSEYAFPNMTVLTAEFELQPDDGGARDRMEFYNQKRKNSQPLNYPSAGSTFKRPKGYYAAALIDQAGLKGTRVGGACVSEKHAGFIVNDMNAKSRDVTDLMEIVHKTVYEKFGVHLEPEVIVLK
ncbi:MAG: UDP-N-acetylmuramate dehydrogenase [Clostridiales bacterium]|nr:UDP-N-acetylmuramate dehydrogenase [Clostridiales bacterium]